MLLLNAIKWMKWAGTSQSQVGSHLGAVYTVGFSGPVFKNTGALYTEAKSLPL